MRRGIQFVKDDLVTLVTGFAPERTLVQDDVGNRRLARWRLIDEFNPGDQEVLLRLQFEYRVGIGHIDHVRNGHGNRLHTKAHRDVDQLPLREGLPRFRI